MLAAEAERFIERAMDDGEFGDAGRRICSRKD